MINSLKILCLAVCLLLWVTAHAGPPDFPAPKNAQVKLVGSNMTVGGKTMHIRQFYTQDRMKKVNEFYYRHWAEAEIADMPGYTESDANPPWHIISRLEQGHLLTVQVQRADDGGSWGYLASSPLVQEEIKSKASSIPKMPDTKTLHEMQTSDVGQTGDTMLLSNRHSLNSNTNYYKNYFLQRGWRSDIDQTLPDANMHVLSFTNGKEKINIVLTKEKNNTLIAVNKVVHSIL